MNIVIIIIINIYIALFFKATQSAVALVLKEVGIIMYFSSIVLIMFGAPKFFRLISD